MVVFLNFHNTGKTTWLDALSEGSTEVLISSVFLPPCGAVTLISPANTADSELLTPHFVTTVTRLHWTELRDAAGQREMNMGFKLNLDMDSWLLLL